MSPELCAEALFVSSLQRSADPSPAAVDAAVTAMVLLHGAEGCAELVAQEFGDHPAAAVERMRWCRTAVRRSLTRVPV